MKDKLKIGIVCYPTYGGSGVVATELGIAFAEKGHEVHFISYDQPFRLELFSDKIYYHEVNIPSYPLFEYTPYELNLTSKLVDVTIHEKLDILHVHYAIPHASAAVNAKQILLTHSINIPIVTTLHGTDITLLGKDKSFKPVIEYAINSSDAITTVSQNLKDVTHDNFKIKRVVVSTYQATSGAGKPAMDELFNQTKGIFVNQEVKSEEFTKQIAFNVIPHIDIFMDDGSTKEEWKMVFETKKILDPSINIISTCVRVPVFIGHSEAVFVELEKPYEEKNIKQIFRKTKSISIVDHRVDEGYVTPLEAAGEDSVFLSRIRRDNTVKSGISFWCVADNLRKGAALNAVQIAENL